MDNKALLDRLAAQASILEHHIKRLQKKPGELHELDVELMTEKIKVIYDLVHELQPGNKPKKQDDLLISEVEKVPMVEVKPEPEIPTPKAPEMSSEIRDPSAEQENKPEPSNELPEAPPAPSSQPPLPEVVIEQPEPSNEQPATSDEEPAASSQEPEADDVPKTTADLFSGPTTIADKFQANDDNSIASKVNPAVVRDLKTAIGINDKFLFINELFKGDPSVYNKAIDNLNTAGGAHEASAAIESYRSEYTWADNSEAYHRLKKIVMSKYNG